MSEGETARLLRLERSLGDHLGSSHVRVQPYRDGVDCWVDLVERPGTPAAVVRSAKVERQLTRYDGLVDFGVEVQKQVTVAQLLQANAVPTPRVLAWHVTRNPAEEPSWMLLELVEHDPADWSDTGLQYELGVLARQIHAIAPQGEAASQLGPGQPWDTWIVDRIVLRLTAAATYIAVPKETDLRRALASVIGSRPPPDLALLHLDLRPPNLAVRDGRIIGVFDLGNAIVGDPLLELARIRGSGLLSGPFLRGYGMSPSRLAEQKAILDAYELDLSALLVVVSREEFDDRELHVAMSKRTLGLIERLGVSA